MEIPNSNAHEKYTVRNYSSRSSPHRTCSRRPAHIPACTSGNTAVHNSFSAAKCCSRGQHAQEKMEEYTWATYQRNHKEPSSPSGMLSSLRERVYLPEMMVGEILRSHQELAAGGVWVSAWICERTDCRVLVRRWLILQHSSSALGHGRWKAQRVTCERETASPRVVDVECVVVF